VPNRFLQQKFQNDTDGMRLLPAGGSEQPKYAGTTVIFGNSETVKTEKQRMEKDDDCSISSCREKTAKNQTL